MPKLLNQAEAASLLGLSARTIQRYISHGSLVPVRLGGRVFLSEKELESIQRDGLPVLRPAQAEEPKA